MVFFQAIVAFTLPNCYASSRFFQGKQTHRESESSCTKQSICAVSANAFAEFQPLFDACMESDSSTSVVALGLQEFTPNPPSPTDPRATSDSSESDSKAEDVKHQHKLPNYINVGETQFKLRHQMMLFNGEDNTMGKGNFCYSKFLGGAQAMAAIGFAGGATYGLIGGPKGSIIAGVLGAVGGAIGGYVMGSAMSPDISCGGVVVAIYSRRKVKVSFDVKQESTHKIAHTGTTWQTQKGTIAMRFAINGRQIIVASTHAQEGVRGKHRGEPVKNQQEESKMLQSEKKRVSDFRDGLRAIQSIGGADDDVAILWVGDFNPRSVQPESGYAYFGPNGYARRPNNGSVDNLNPDGLARLRHSKDILGIIPQQGEPVHATFTHELRDSGLSEIQFLESEDCPTYSKAKFVSDDKKHQFTCMSAKHGLQYYNWKKPPSWADRIFSKNPSWLKGVGVLQRVPRNLDHDAIYAQFEVSSPSC